MTIEPPQPPTAPAPAVRPTPPTPPRIDMAPFRHSGDETSAPADESAEPAESAEPVNEPQVERKVDTPETMARDAVANGSGALTKRTVNRDDDNPPAKPNQTVTVIPPDAPLVNDGQSDYDRGKDVLRQFQELDAQQSTSTPAQTSTEQSNTKL